MIGRWFYGIAAWLGRKETRAARRVRARRRMRRLPQGALVGPLEILESRELLTNVVGVHVAGNSIVLNELRGGQASSAFDFNIAYTSSQVVLTGSNGTEFRVGGQTLATDTLNLTGPASITLRLNRHANAVTISGDGSSQLASLNLRLSTGRQPSALNLDSVIANSVSINGRRPSDNVTLHQSTVNGNLTAFLGSAAGDVLDLESTTVKGNLQDMVGKLITNDSTITGKVHNVEPSGNSSLASTSSTFSGPVSIRMGAGSVIDLHSSASGENQFQSSVSVTGKANHNITVNQDQGSTTFDVAPTYRHATVVNTPATPTSPTLGKPTVDSQTVTTNNAPVITGSFDAVNSAVFTVSANGKLFTLGTDSQLTSPTSGKWSLNLGGATLAQPVTTVTATSTDKNGNQQTGTGTITDGAGIINNYLAANKLTATTTADGLAIVIQTNGTGAVPKKGQTVIVDYSGFLLNPDATRGTEFDSNVDSKFNHVTPFSFVLGAGQVIPGWDEAFAQLPVGTVAELVIPSALAYGTTGHGTSIPPNSILIFDVTVLSAA